MQYVLIYKCMSCIKANRQSYIYIWNFCVNMFNTFYDIYYISMKYRYKSIHILSEIDKYIFLASKCYKAHGRNFM